jgi:hypothetical protein
MELRMRGGYIGRSATGLERRNNNNGETEMPTVDWAVTWDHVHLRSPDPEATAAWLEDILGGEIIRGPGRIDVKRAPMCSSHPSPPATASTPRR